MFPNKKYNFMRRCLCFFNLIFWITGCCLIGIGIWLAISDYQYFRILPSYHFLSADNLILFCGILVTFISFFGCCGSWFESKILLHFYLILILVIMIVEILTGSLGYYYKLTVHKQLKYELLTGIKKHYNESNSNGLKYTWDFLQTHLKCCGVLNYTDWHNIRAWPGLSKYFLINHSDDIVINLEKTGKIPGSCCVLPKPNSIIYSSGRPDIDQLHCNIIYQHGCFAEINNYILTHLYIVGITFIVFAFVQFFAFLTSLLMIYTIKSQSNYSIQNSFNPTYNRVPTLD